MLTYLPFSSSPSTWSPSDSGFSLVIITSNVSPCSSSSWSLAVCKLRNSHTVYAPDPNKAIIKVTEKQEKN